MTLTALATARSHVDAVETALKAVGLRVYRGSTPVSPTSVLPYTVLRFNASYYTGTIYDPNADFDIVVQTNAVGNSENSAEAEHDRIAPVFLRPGFITPPSGRAWLGPHYQELSTPAQPDYDLTPPLFYLVAMWRLQSTPT